MDHQDAIRRRLAKIGLLELKRVAAGQALADHLTDFKAALRAKGNTEKHVNLVATRVKAIFDGCGFRLWSDIDRVETHLARLRQATEKDGKTIRGIGCQTSNFYLTAVKEFCGWMVRNGRASQSPVAFLRGLNVKRDPQHARRALSVDELQRLFAAAQKGPDVLGASGPERRLIYLTAAGTGCRADELRTLTADCLDLDAAPPTITIRAAYSKRRRQDTQPIRRDLADLLRQWVDGRAVGQPVFTVPDDPAEMIKRDLDAARTAWLDEVKDDPAAKKAREASDFLKYEDSAKRFADFHALRHSYVSMVIAGGASPKPAMDLARHSDPKLTFGRYGHAFLNELVKPLANLPGIAPGPKPQAVELRKTGTDDEPARKGQTVLASRWTLRGAKRRTLTNFDELGRTENRRNGQTRNWPTDCVLMARNRQKDFKNKQRAR